MYDGVSVTVAVTDIVIDGEAAKAAVFVGVAAAVSSGRAVNVAAGCVVPVLVGCAVSTGVTV